MLVAVLFEVFLSAVLIGTPHPSFVLLLALPVGIVRTPPEGALVAFGGGLLLDALAGPPLGRQALALVVAALPVFLGRMESTRRTILAPALAVTVGTVLYWLALGLCDAALGLSTPWLSLGLRWALPTLVMNAVLALPLFGLVGWLSVRALPGLPAR